MDGKYPNKNLSGANVTYKFIEAYCNKYHPEYNYVKFLSLVGLANVADAIDLRSYEARQYALMGIEQMEDDKARAEKGLDIVGNKFIQAIIDKKKDRDLKHINVTSIGWFISPIINGTIRFGEHEEKVDLFKALLNENDDRIYQPRRKKKEDPKPEPITVTLQEHAVRVCTNAKARQDKTVAKAKEELVSKIEEKDLNSNKILMVNATDILEKSLTGLVANKLANDYKKPVLIFKQMNDEICGGSARNYNLSPIPELKDFLVDLDIFEECLGHQGAFGMKIKIENMLEARDLINEKLKDVEMVDTWVVDYQIPVRRIKEQDILDLGLRREVWGNGVHKPLFAITGVTLQTKDIALLGDKANMISFKVDNLRFIKFFTNVDEYNRMIMRDTGGFSRATPTVNMDLIVEFSVNEYEGRNYPECVIVDYNVSKAVDKMF
jgi:single-stranded-DNA-specific exonuclease